MLVEQAIIRSSFRLLGFFFVLVICVNLRESKKREIMIEEIYEKYY